MGQHSNELSNLAMAYPQILINASKAKHFNKSKVFLLVQNLFQSYSQTSQEIS